MLTLEASKREKETMAINANELINALPAFRRRKIEKRAAQLIEEEMTLQQLRKSRGPHSIGACESYACRTKSGLRN